MTTAIGATTIEITPLMLACQNGNLEDVKSMLTKGASVEAKDSNNRTAIFYCAENVELDCIEELLKHKADVNHQDKDGYSCLHLAVICGNQLIVEYLVEHGADINMTDSEMHSATHWSVVCGQEAILDYLLAHNADPETADIHGAYPIHYAAQMCGHIDVWDESINRDSTKSLIILRKLIQQKVKIDAEDFDQRNAIIWAASSGSSEALLELFLAGGDPNKHEKDGLTALHCASSRNHLECIRVLIEECKTSVDIMDNNNCTPIFYAATLGQLDACHLLIKYGANLHVQDCKGRTVYHCAAAKGQLRCLKSLCKQNPTIWLRNRRGDYPIHEAYYNRQMECVYYLLDAITDKQAPHASNMYDGRTLLHLAAADNDLKLCKRLVGGDGCDVNCLMKTSPTTYMTPYDVAIIKKSAECARYLKSLGGLSGTEVVSKLQQSAKPAKQKNQGDSVLKKNSKSKANTSSSSNDSKVMEARRERLKSIERTTFNEQISGDKSNKNENNSKTKNSNEEHDNNIEYTETEESGGGGAANGRGRGEETSDETETNQEETKKSVTTKVEQKQSQQQNKKPIMEQRQMNKSMITESSERQKKRDAVLAAQMAQAQAERERRRKQQQQQQKEQEERDKQKMNNLNSMYTQVKSKSTVSRGARDKSGRPQQKDSIVSKKQNQSQERTNTNKDSSFLPTLINNGEREKKRNNQEKKETTKGAGKKTESDEATTTTTTMNGNKDAAPEKDDEGVIKSKYNRYVSDDEEDENDDDVNNWYVRKRSEGMALAVREPTKQTLKGRRKEKSFVNNKSTSKKKDDYDDDDDEEEFKNIHDNSDNTSLTNEKTPRKSEVGSKASRKRNLELPSPNRQSRHQTKSKVLVGDSVATTSNPDEENMVRLIIKNDQISGDSSLARKRYASLFDKQRLVLKSLYEIRRCRINNRDIIVSSDLNNMLIKSYDYDIRKNCRSLRDLEKMLEIIAVEISDEYRKNNKRSQTLLTFKPKPANNPWRSTDNIARSEKRLNDEKSKSQMADSSPMAESLRFRQERIQAQNDHLKVAYRPLLPNDIYKQYYHTNSKYTAQKEQPERKEKSIILPVISQKPSFTI